MKRIGALSGMKWLMLLLVFQAGYNATVAAQEINPLDFVPLAVGNSWTYEHSYVNGSYTDEGPGYDIEVRKPFEIPGYPHGEGNALPPVSLLWPMNSILTIEITHTERIDGQEYFVFSDAEYDWPPLPEFFWAGKKVRWSDEGFLVFRWVGREVPIFDVGGLINDSYSYSITLPWESAPPVDIRRRGWFYEAPQTSKLHYLVNFDWYRWESDGTWLGSRNCNFLPGYGIGRFSEAFYGLHFPIFENILTGISANIDGEEIWYDQLDPEGQRPPPEPIAVGKLAQHEVFSLFAGLPTQIDTVRIYQGFDFSAGSAGGEGDYYDGEGLEPGTDDLGLHQLTTNDGSPTTPGKFRTPPSGDIVDLDIDVDPFKVIFRPVRKNGIGSVEIIEGHTYAVWPLDGGLALMYVFYVGLRQTSFPKAGGAVADVVIEWVYDPEWTFESPTAIQSTSWGRLKSNILRGP